MLFPFTSYNNTLLINRGVDYWEQMQYHGLIWLMVYFIVEEGGSLEFNY